MDRPPIAFALDFKTATEARAAAKEVAREVGMLKIGLELFVAEGPKVVTRLAKMGLPIFLDLKLHDIPETVERAVERAAKLGATLVTVHAAGGRAMLRAAVTKAKGTGLAICAVTILTSLDDGDLRDIGMKARPRAAALQLAKMAFDEGVRWFVCSPAEVSTLRKALGPSAVLVTPGVRPADSAKGDQKRTATPEQAIADGATWVVVGRPIRDALNRRDAARAIAHGIRNAQRPPRRPTKRGARK